MCTICQLFIFSLISMHGFCLHDVTPLIDCLSACSKESCEDACNKYMYRTDLYPQVKECTDANVTLHCTGGNLMTIKFNPGLYFIEQVPYNYTWNSTKLLLTRDLQELRRIAKSAITPGQRCVHLPRVTDLHFSGISRPEISDWFSTYPANYEPMPVNNVSVKIEADRQKIGKLHTKVAFEPAMDRSCNYEVRIWDGEHYFHRFIIDTISNFRIKLEMDKSTNLTIKSVNKENGKASPEFSMTLCTLSCAEYYNYNLSVCPPDSVEGLEVQHVYHYPDMYDMWIRWNETAFKPDNYSIEIDLNRNGSDPLVKTVPGNTTEIFLENLTLNNEYTVIIVAESLGGESAPVNIVRTVEPRHAPVKKFYRELVIGIMIPITFFAIIGITFFQYYQQKIKNKKLSAELSIENVNLKDMSIETIKKLLYQHSDSEANTPLMNDKFNLCPKILKVKDILGSGAYGVVRLGSLQDQFNNTTSVAVKMLKENPSVEDLKNFCQEIMIMKAAGQHPNIVSLIGCCILDNKPVLVVEYCCKGDLQLYLRTIWQNMVSVAFKHKAQFKLDEDLLSINGIKYDPNTCGGKNHNYQNVQTITNHLYDIQQDLAQYTETVTANDLLNFARQIATGMEFLALNRIVHRDLAARNILVCEDKVVKISDFGLSRDVYQENLYRKQGSGKLPVKWMAIESLTHQIYTTHSDVWSFGILLWEIVTIGALPYPGIPTNVILKLLKSGYRLERPTSCSVELYNIMSSCWNVRPQSRPTFTELKESLDKLLSHYSENKYLNIDEILYDGQEQYHVVDDHL
nr:PREDICTED: tyrosine-protein kinase receptor torso-like isoform X3 [Megachile rotundata]